MSGHVASDAYDINVRFGFEVRIVRERLARLRNLQTGQKAVYFHYLGAPLCWAEKGEWGQSSPDSAT